MTQENRLETVELELADLRREVVELKRRMDHELEVERRPVAQKRASATLVSRADSDKLR